MGGHITLPGITYYCGSKFALEGISEALGKEVAALGISVTAVAPGSFRTDWAGRSMARTPRSIPDYDAIFDPLRKAREEVSGRQLGDPAKAARAMLAAISAHQLPAHLLLGSDALRLVRSKMAALEREIEAWEAVTVSTDG
jgi:NAD(P)-dependent dehydrogenase (short-subunit alcohol dehydrogenase family)